MTFLKRGSTAVGQEEDAQDFTLLGQTQAIMANDEEDWPSRRESAPIMNKFSSTQIAQETPPHFTTIGGVGVMETAETYKLSGSETGCVTGRGGAEGMLESVQDFGVQNECALNEQHAEADFAEP
jgi:hypothetical protein